MTPLRRLCIIGVGLIGGSLARALRQAKAVDTVVGAGRHPAHLQRAVELDVIDEFTTDLAAAVDGADMVVIAVPLKAIRPVLKAIAGRLAPEAILTDVGSAKQCVVDDVRDIFGHLPGTFIPGHPIAGTECSGVDASFAELFQRRRVILTPLLESQAWAHARVKAMWTITGAEVIDMGVRHHDAVLAATSHLPHMLAYTLVDSLARLDSRAEIFRYAAGGFRDFTRIASSDPTMWHDVCVANREPLLDTLRQFSHDLDQLTQAIEQGDSDAIMQTFQRAKHARDNLYLD